MAQCSTLGLGERVIRCRFRFTGHTGPRLGKGKILACKAGSLFITGPGDGKELNWHANSQWITGPGDKEWSLNGILVQV